MIGISNCVSFSHAYFRPCNQSWTSELDSERGFSFSNAFFISNTTCNSNTEQKRTKHNVTPNVLSISQVQIMHIYINSKKCCKYCYCTEDLSLQDRQLSLSGATRGPQHLVSRSVFPSYEYHQLLCYGKVAKLVISRNSYLHQHSWTPRSYWYSMRKLPACFAY